MEGNGEICLYGGSSCCKKRMNLNALVQLCAYLCSSLCPEVIMSNTWSLWLNCMEVIKTMFQSRNCLQCPFCDSSLTQVNDAGVCLLLSLWPAAVSCKAICFCRIWHLWLVLWFTPNPKLLEASMPLKEVKLLSPTLFPILAETLSCAVPALAGYNY